MPLQVGRIRRTVSIAAANHRNIAGHKTHSNCWALGAAPGTTPGVPAVWLGAFYWQGWAVKRYTQQVIQADTADAAPLNSSVMCHAGVGL